MQDQRRSPPFQARTKESRPYVTRAVGLGEPTGQLQAYHDHLVQEANHYKDPFVIESEARQQLGYIRPGEHPVVIAGSSNQQGQQGTAQPASPPATQNLWQEWWNVFFGN